MKVLHITTSSKGGAGIAAKRLHDALSENGMQSGFLSTNLTIDFTNQIVKDSFFVYHKPSLLTRGYLKVKSLFFQGKYQRASVQLQKMNDRLQCEIVTLPFSVYQLHKHPLVQEADIINLHWIGGILDYTSFFEHCRKPIVWTLHDRSPFQGLFHYKDDELVNAKISANFDDEMKQIKSAAINKIENGTLVTPSKWLLSESGKSSVFSHFKKKCIPYSLDFNVFKQQDKIAVRKEHSLTSEDFIILFVADSLKNHRKGFDLLIEALSLLEAVPITVVAIGKGEMPFVACLKMISLGEITTSNEMAKCYALADVFVLPSREDNLPNVMLEAFACGIPVIGFPIGGIAEHVKWDLTGVLAEEMSGLSLAKAIHLFYETKANYKSDAIRKYAEDNFSSKKQALGYMDIYETKI